MWQKFEFYIISLFFLFFLLFINRVPVCLIANSEFVSFCSLFTTYLLITLCVVLMIFGIIFFFKFQFNFKNGSALLPIKVSKIENINFESVTFLATYIVPLACIDLDKDRSALMLIIILILIGWIYIKTNLFYTNPTLAVLGYHIYKISSDTKFDITIITRKKIIIGDELFLKNIDDKIYLAKHTL
ncbi:MAG: anti-phage protein KwaA [Paludibacter sp.]